MTCNRNKSFSSSYMLLKPEEVGFIDLFHILFCRGIKKRKFVDSSDTEDQSFGLRMIVLISITVQLLLKRVAKPLAVIGSTIEFVLNLLTSNGSFFGLLLNFLRGKVVIPDKSSASFKSIVAILDERTELDSSIRRGDNESYYGTLSMMASKASYENKAYVENIVTNHWKMEYLGSYDYWNDYQEKATTQAFMLYDKNGEQDIIVVAFRGTEPFDAEAWNTDVDISWYEMDSMGKVHYGFMIALGLQKNVGWPKEISKEANRPAPLAYYAIRDTLLELLNKNPRAKFIVTGHSLGGALAILFPAVLALHEEKWLLDRLEGIYTFGQPRVGDKKFVEFMIHKLKEHRVKYFRFVYNNDIVPRLPFDNKGLMFKHFGNCIFYNRRYEPKLLPEEPNKNYFSPFQAIPMVIDAFWELVRSFILPLKKGPDYKEGWLLKSCRVFGLIVPGIPDHNPQDYVNSTRLGSLDAFFSYK